MLSRYVMRDRLALVAAVVLPFLVALCLVPFREWLADTSAALVLVVSVVVVAAYGTRLAGAIAAVSAAAWYDFFLTQPYQRFTIADAEDVETAVLLLAVGLIVGQLSVRVRRLEVVTVTSADHLSRLHKAAHIAQGRGASQAMVEHVQRQLVELLDLDGCRFEYGKLTGRPARLNSDGGVTVGGEVWNVERDGWPEGEIELRASGSGGYHGRFMLAPKRASIPSVQARRVAVTLAEQTGSALDTAA